MSVEINAKELTIIENGEEKKLSFEECWQRSCQYLAEAITKYDATHDEEFEKKPEEFQDEFTQRVTKEFFDELEKKKVKQGKE